MFTEHILIIFLVIRSILANAAFTTHYLLFLAKTPTNKLPFTYSQILNFLILAIISFILQLIFTVRFLTCTFTLAIPSIFSFKTWQYSILKLLHLLCHTLQNFHQKTINLIHLLILDFLLMDAMTN